MGHQKFKIIKVEGTPEWMISFGDLMSCLLVFFVLLLTFSSSKPAKLMDMLGDYVGAGSEESSQDSGDTLGGAGVLKRVAVDPDEEAPIKLANLVINQKYNDFKDRLYRMGFKHEISYSQTEEGFYIETDESAVIGKDGNILAEAKPLLQTMANVAISVRKELRVTDILAESGRYEGISGTKAFEAENSAYKIQEFLEKRYKVKEYTMSCGIGFGKVKANKIRFLVADSLEGKAITLADITKKG